MFEEREVSDVFLKNIDEFCKNSDTIFSEFEAIRENAAKGENIMDLLREFKLKRASIFALIDAIFHKAVDLEDKLDKAEIAKEKRDKLLEFKKQFADLADDIDLFVIKELGVGQR